MRQQRAIRVRQRGFSLLEMIIAVALMSIVAVAVLSQVDLATQRSVTEQVKVDDFQEARDFVDQFFRDINQIGYPNIRMVTTAGYSGGLTQQTSYTYANAYINDTHFAVGLVKIDQNAIWFEADTNGDGTVQSVIYKLNGSGSCSLCLQRSQLAKVTGDPLTTANTNASWGTEVNDVQNTPIFTYYKADGTKVDLSGGAIDYTTQANANILASIKTIQIALQIRNPTLRDLKTLEPVETNLSGEVSINNCSMAAAGQAMSC